MCLPDYSGRRSSRPVRFPLLCATKTGHGIIELLRELNRDGATLVIITHDRELVATLPRQVEIRDGRIIHDNAAEPEEVVA